jgi:CheY-like chemotaxis protein/HPt (histidine-containing phosphotransfer) domain-containing protein
MFSPTMPMPLLLGDPYRLNQIILNLLTNAIKFTEKGEITLTTRVVAENEEILMLEFLVRDTGIGIPNDKRVAIFEGFTQAHASTTRKYGGTGLGLTICKSLVEQQEGSIWVESEVGKGSDFRFVLPFRKSLEAVTRADAQTKSDWGQLHHVRVLLAEDNEINQFLAVKILSGWGAEVDVAVNGKEALALLEKRHYDLVLMDIQMPIMGGTEATAHIRRMADPSKANVPIIALTANALKGDEEKFMAAGMSGYLSKPFEEEKLFHKIAYHLKRGDMPQPISRQEESCAPLASTLPVAAQPLFDLGQLQKLCAGDQAFIQKLLQMFLEIVPGYLQQIKFYQEEGNWREVAAIAHKLKPNIDTMGILLLKEDIRMLEKNAKNETDIPELPLLINRLELVMNEVLENVKEVHDSFQLSAAT